MHATDVPSQDALMAVGVDLLRKLGFHVTTLLRIGAQWCKAALTRRPLGRAGGAY